MKKRFLISTFAVGLALAALGQRLIYDAGHLAIVNQNGAVRLAAEQTHNHMLGTIRQRIDDINVNLSSVVLVKNMIHRSLTEVDRALKSGRSVLHISRLTADIARHSTKLLETAQSEPWLLLFAEGLARELKDRGVHLAAEVSEFVLQEGKNVLMDYQNRDHLLRKIILELKIIRALLFGMERSIYYAKAGGALKTANPFRHFINKDPSKADEILRSYDLIKDGLQKHQPAQHIPAMNSMRAVIP